MSLSSLLAVLPPTAVYRRVPLDRHRNALEVWREAVQDFVIPTGDRSRWIDLVEASPAAIAPIPREQRQFAEEVLRQNAGCLEALDKGLERGQLRFELFGPGRAGTELFGPGRAGTELFQSLEHLVADSDFAVRLSDVARLHLIRFRLWFFAGDMVAAGEELFRLDKIGSLICNGDGQILHYLVGLWLQAAAVRGYGRVAASLQAPKPVLERILHTLEENLQSPDGLAQSLRVDLATIALPQLERTSEGPDLENVVRSLLEVYYLLGRNQEARSCGRERAAIADGWLEERRQQILFLLRDHPNAFDRASTARWLGVMVAETIRDLRAARRPSFLAVAGRWQGLRRKMRLRRLLRKARFWPVELTPGMRIESLAGMGSPPHDKGTITTIRLPSANLSPARLATLRMKLRAIENPIGLMLAAHHTACDYSHHLLEHLRMMKTMHGLIKQRLKLDDVDLT
jgi:hypothetical protein